MTALFGTEDLLACPACGRRLVQSSCLACRLDFPVFGDVPWLFAEPRMALREWRGRLRYLLAHYAEEAARQRAALAGAPAGGLTAGRLAGMADALEDQAARIGRLLAPLGLVDREEALAVHVALGTELPQQQGLSTYYANLHRDWNWGAAENDASLAAVVRVLPANLKPRRLLVLGAGAGRLAYDLHQRLGPALTVALDFNPLFVLAARQLVHGGRLELYEFPVAPRDIGDQAILRKLQAPAPAENLEFVLADAAAPPFLPGSFDLVLTPWFIDVAGEPAARVMRRINRLLPAGGIWLNHGSLVFAHQPPEQSLSLPELLQRLPEAGFGSAEADEARLPYLSSPASRHARTESVITFAARKERDVECPPPGREVPAWLARNDRPVPALPEFSGQALATRVYAFLLAMIDGERSIADMAKLMEQQKLMPAADAEPAIRSFLERLLRSKDQRDGF